MTPDQGGRTPLHYAAADDDAPQVLSLLAAGADPEAADDEGLCPFTSRQSREAWMLPASFFRSVPRSTAPTCLATRPCRWPCSSPRVAGI